MIRSANRDPSSLPDAGRFDIGRDPTIALSDLLERFKNIEFATDQPWQARHALDVLGPARLPIRIETDRRAAALA
jgi:cytochrome P450